MSHQFQSLVEVLQYRAQNSPNKKAYIYVEENHQEEITYQQIEKHAQNIACRLNQTYSPLERALLLYPSGIDILPAIFGCFQAGIIAVPAPAPHPNRLHRTINRVISIIESAQPKVILTISKISDFFPKTLEENQQIQPIEWIATDKISEKHTTPCSYEIKGDTIAFLQYTSGSTTSPKGVILNHNNLLHNLGYLDQGWNHNPDSTLVTWLPNFHDLGLIYGLLQPLFNGFLGIIMSPEEVVQHPIRWLKTITDYKATHSAGPNFIYELCTKKVTAPECQTLNLQSWQVALNAAEPIRQDTMRKFHDKFKTAGFNWNSFSPGYGLSEGTCKVVATKANDEPYLFHADEKQLLNNIVKSVPAETREKKSIVACGHPQSDVSIKIVNARTKTECSPGQIGEIWLNGPCVGQGYWERPEETRQNFMAKLVNEEKTYLRTGDLGFMHEGQLYITGRLKNMIIILGQNYYPQDIEYTVQQAHKSVRPGCCTAFSMEVQGEERLVIVAEIERRHHDRRFNAIKQVINDRRITERRKIIALPLLTDPPGPPDQEEIISAITQCVRETYGLEIEKLVLIVAGTIPKTSSGKLQHFECRKNLLEGALKTI